MRGACLMRLVQATTSWQRVHFFSSVMPVQAIFHQCNSGRLTCTVSTHLRPRRLVMPFMIGIHGPPGTVDSIDFS